MFYDLKQPHFLPRDFKIDLEIPGTGKVEEAIPPETMSYKLVSPSDHKDIDRLDRSPEL